MANQVDDLIKVEPRCTKYGSPLKEQPLLKLDAAIAIIASAGRPGSPATSVAVAGVDGASGTARPGTIEG